MKVATIDTTGICPGCSDYNQRYECVDCGLDLELDCKCVYGEDDSITIYCHGCGTVFERAVSSIVNFDDELFSVRDYEEEEDDWERYKEYWDNSWASVADLADTTSSRTFTKCRHFNKPVEFPDGTTVYASSLFTRGKDEEVPDFGLYLDPSWDAPCLAYQPYWADYDIPSNAKVAVMAIVDVFNKASQAGMWVEVGCIGGHGRTGTVLACMAVLAGLEHDEAIKFVHENYCHHAIETKEQEWWVEWFQVYVKGGTCSGYPTWDSTTKKYTYGPSFVFEDYLDWESYDPEAHPKGGPEYVFEDEWDFTETFELDDDDDGDDIDIAEIIDLHDALVESAKEELASTDKDTYYADEIF